MTELTMHVGELVLELANTNLIGQSDECCVEAVSTLTFFNGSQTPIRSKPSPLNISLKSIDSTELSWYLERYAQWPTGSFRKRAEAVEQALPVWGQMLCESITTDETASRLFRDWRSSIGRLKFTVQVNMNESVQLGHSTLPAAKLLGLPWELMHDGRNFILHGDNPVVLRRQIGSRGLRHSPSELPVRILVVSPRPEDDQASYIDHRASALPLLQALEGAVDFDLKILAVPTFEELNKELRRASAEGKPYHVLHFDGHGAYSPGYGGALCFEDPRDTGIVTHRRSKLVPAPEVAALLRDQNVRLVFLDACHSGRADDLTASVAVALLEGGVPSVVAMTHAVLVETSRRFVSAFYNSLATQSTTGEAVRAGQSFLKTDTFRLEVPSAGALHLQDWFVPLLFQSGEDKALFASKPKTVGQGESYRIADSRLSGFPPVPSHSFVGRSRELLALERLQLTSRYGVIRGLGGEGKTTLATELARWLVRTSRFDEAYFISLEEIFNVRTFLDALGRDLLQDYSVAQYSGEQDINQLLLSIEKRLERSTVLIIIDNFESALPDAGGMPGNLDSASLSKLLDICERLSQIGTSRLFFTTRELLPAPFDAADKVLTIGPLEHSDALMLLQQTLIQHGTSRSFPDLDVVTAMVDAVWSHAQSIVLLASYAAEMGFERTTENVRQLMSRLHQRYPLERERSLFASIELSLSRLPTGMRERIRPLGLFQGGAKKAAIAALLNLNANEKQDLANTLIKWGLATQVTNTSYLRFHPAFSPLLLTELEGEALELAKKKWLEVMSALVSYLYSIEADNPTTAAGLTMLDVPNLLSYAQHLRNAEDKSVALETTLALEQLLMFLARPDVSDSIKEIREQIAATVGGWGPVQFEAASAHVEVLMNSGNLVEALKAADSLVQKALTAGDEDAYPDAAKHIVQAINLKGAIFNRGDAAEAALELFREAERRLTLITEKDPAYDRLLSSVIGGIAQCYLRLGRADEAAQLLRKQIKKYEETNQSRAIAVARHWLGYANFKQYRYEEALEEFMNARDIFEMIGESVSVGQAYHMIGAVLQHMESFDEAEIAFKSALAINVQQKNKIEEAKNLVQLAHLYRDMEKFTEAADLYHEAILRNRETGNLAGEGRCYLGLASVLLSVGRYDEARPNIWRGIECHKNLGVAVEPWWGWGLLAELEIAVGNTSAATSALKQARASFLEFRRQQGSFQTQAGKICDSFVRDYLNNDKANIREQLRILAADELNDSIRAVIRALTSIVEGGREVSLAGDPQMTFYDAAEVLWVLERLKNA